MEAATRTRGLRCVALMPSLPARAFPVLSECLMRFREAGRIVAQAPFSVKKNVAQNSRSLVPDARPIPRLLVTTPARC